MSTKQSTKVKQKKKANPKRVPPAQWKKMSKEQQQAMIASRNRVEKVVDKQLKVKYRTRGVDPRDVSSESVLASSPLVSNQVRTIDRKCFLNPDALVTVLIGMFDQFNEFGFYASLSNKVEAYYAMQYVYNYIIDCAENGTMSISAAPLCIKLLGDAIRPKRKKFKTGEMFFTWDLSDAKGYEIPYKYGSGLLVDFGIPDGTQTINGFPAIIPGAVYTDELGSTAYQKLIGYLGDLSGASKMTIVSASGTPTLLKNDVSAFAYVFSEVGVESYSGIGGYNSETYLQTKITAPLLSVFNQWTEGSAAAVEMHVTSGGGFATGSRLVTLADPEQVKDKPKTIMKKIDMNDLFSLLSFLVGTAVERAVTNNATSSFVPTCPLTVQEVHLLLRLCAGATAYKVAGSDITETNTFPYVITWRPLQWSFANANPAINARTILFPTVFVENMHSLAPVITNLKDFKGGRAQCLWFQPIFGYWGDPLGMFTTSQGPLYSVSASEIPIDIPNMVANIGTNPVLALAGVQLDTMITMWNEWIGGLNQYLALSQFGGSKGCNALKSLTLTRHVQLVPGEEPPPPPTANVVGGNPKAVVPTMNPQTFAKDLRTGGKRASVKQVGRILTRKLKVVNVDPPVTGLIPTVSAVTSNQPIVESAWRLCQGAWVLPKEIVYGTFFEEQVRNRSIISVEPNVLWSTGLTLTSIVDSTELFTYFRQLSESFATSFMGKESESQIAFRTLIEKGEGGFFGDLVSDFSTHVLDIPLLASLGKLIPF